MYSQRLKLKLGQIAVTVYSHLATETPVTQSMCKTRGEPTCSKPTYSMCQLLD